MKTDTRKKIYDLCKQEGGIRPHDLVKELGITNAAIHRHLRALMGLGHIEKMGMAPFVTYVAIEKHEEKPPIVSFPEDVEKIINHHYCYFLPNGKELLGIPAFLLFLKRTNQEKHPINRAKEYIEIVQTANSFKDKDGLISARNKIEKTFDKIFLNDAYYSDFYSLPKYGKTMLGQYILYGKSGQDRALIKKVAEITMDHIKLILAKHKIDAICYVPHSIPRKIPFLNEFKLLLNIKLPEIKMTKIYSGSVPIAQKSLSKLSERIENARQTILILDQNRTFKRVLIIDDALGSGATLNEVGRKLSKKSRSVWGYSIVGSFKGFEVIKEI